MSVLPSMVHRSGDTLVVRSVVSGDPLYEDVFSSCATAITGSSKLDFYSDDHKQQDRSQGKDDLNQQPGRVTNLPECKVKRNYSCSICEYFTQNPRNYLYHLRDVHREKVKVYECPSCLYASKHYQKLLRHTRMVHGRNATNSCAIQEKHNLKLSSNVSTTSHGRRKRGGGIGAVVIKEEGITCDEAMQTSPRPADDDQQNEEEEDDDDEGHNLEIDELQATTQEGRSDTGNIKFQCALCSFVAKGQQQLTKHESEVHIRTKFFRCTKCSYVTHIKARYTKHVKYHSMPMIKCDLCDFRTPYKWNLDRHCKNHNGRGAFRCSACNFTADIKQSLTVHEMNHHVPPVGQAAMAAAAAAAATACPGGGATSTSTHVLGHISTTSGPTGSTRRRNKVGASDTAYMDNKVEEYQSKPKTKNLSDLLSFHNTSITKSNTLSTSAPAYTSADFVHPDDIVERPNGHIYLKSQCNLCNFKTAYDAEMVKHERTHHSSSSFPQHPSPAPSRQKKTPRPVPNLIPIRSPPNMLSAKELHDITLGSSNSALKDYAPLFGSEEFFKPLQAHLLPADPNFKEKNASFFDKLKEKLLSHDSSPDLVCQRCGHESKCLTESVSHLKICGKEIDRLTDTGTPPLSCNNNNTIASVLSSTRCQYCRQRCKSSADLYIHMQTCTKYQQESEFFGDEDDDEEAEHMEIEMRPEDILSVEEQQHDNDIQQPHPMENRVFVWNDIEVPMNIDMDEIGPQYPQQPDYSTYYSLMEKAMKQNTTIDEDDVDAVSAVSLDLSIRTQSPINEATPPHPNTKPAKQTHQNQSNTNIFGKVPTHGNDISIAQHKRVFKCPHCSFWASTASRFHVHIVGHLNKKPFECSLCAYRSNWRWDITKHIKLKSVRDPNHESARVLMTDETGRRNYTKYNKYLTEINVPNGNADVVSTNAGAGAKNTNSKGQLLQQQQLMEDALSINSKQNNRPTPDLKATNNNIMVARFAAVMAAQTQAAASERENRKRPSECSPTSALTGNSRRPMYKCGKYSLKETLQEKPTEPVEALYIPKPLNKSSNNDIGAVDKACQLDKQQILLPAVLPDTADGTPSQSSDTSSDAMDMGMRLSSPHGFGDDLVGGNTGDQPTASTARGGSAPFSCGHCHQRHCRLKHHGDISVIVGGRAGHPDRVELDRQPDEPEHLDVPQLGTCKCPHCPYSTDVTAELAAHAVGHAQIEASTDTTITDSSPYTMCKCPVCGYTVAHMAEIYAHLPLHGVGDPVEYMQRANESDPSKRHKCVACPYVTNSKSQYMYHKRFHKPKNGPYKCTKCNYNVTRRHLLNQHMRVHSMGKSEFIDLEEHDELSNSGVDMSSPLMEQLSPSSNTIGNTISVDIPLIWVSRGGKFSKMYKCRHCPHVNMRKVNIQEHEKMHIGNATVSDGSSTGTAVKPEGEHHCTQCDYVCNNAGVLSSHIKVHQNAFGILHCLVDTLKSDEEQIRTLTLSLHQMPKYQQQQQLGIAGMLPSFALTDDTLDMPAEHHIEDDEVVEPPTDVNLATSLAESGDMLYFCHECPARFLKVKEFQIHRKLHGGRLYYKCDYCTYTGRQRPHLNSHTTVHTTEYKKRTANLRSIYPTNPNHPAPIITLAYPDTDCWVIASAPGEVAGAATTNDIVTVELDSDTDINDNNIHEIDTSGRTILAESLMRTTRNTVMTSKESVPLSGTDLFRHRQMAVDAAESRMKSTESSSIGQLKDNKKLTGEGDDEEGFDELTNRPGTFGAGNPDFIYPMCTKNGRQKEKRYKCSKCPTAFEKREQYKIHLGLHGSKQRFQCEECDYSVANSSNFVQHQRKHDVHRGALAAATTAVATTTAATSIIITSTPETDQSKTNVLPPSSSGTQQMFRCTNCPYNSRRRDAVDNHLKRHASVSGIRQAHTCDHCDYSVAQAHILRDHVKMHFAETSTRPQAEAFLPPGAAVKVKVEPEHVTVPGVSGSGRVIFDDKNSCDTETGASTIADEALTVNGEKFEVERSDKLDRTKGNNSKATE